MILLLLNKMKDSMTISNKVYLKIHPLLSLKFVLFLSAKKRERG